MPSFPLGRIWLSPLLSKSGGGVLEAVSYRVNTIAVSQSMSASIQVRVVGLCLVLSLILVGLGLGFKFKEVRNQLPLLSSGMDLNSSSSLAQSWETDVRMTALFFLPSTKYHILFVLLCFLFFFVFFNNC